MTNVDVSIPHIITNLVFWNTHITTNVDVFIPHIMTNVDVSTTQIITNVDVFDHTQNDKR